LPPIKKQALSNLVIRSIAGFFFSITVIGSALLGKEAVALLFLFFAVVGLHEFYTITKLENRHNPRVFAGLLIGILIYTGVYAHIQEILETKYLLLIGALSTFIMAKELFSLDQKAFVNLALTFFGVYYVILPFAGVSVLAMYPGEFTYELPVGFFLILWANDTGAYFTGRSLGRHKLYPEVSPNKTWEGLFGGVLMAMLAGFGLSLLFDDVLNLVHWLVMGIIISIFGNLGDLFESHFKRTFGVKDSGNLIPGHGGVLDRFDGLLMSMPVVLAYLYFVRIF
jgi:phosphatidate cytidylyltransferase